MNTVFLQIGKYLSTCDKFTFKNYNEICKLYGYVNIVNYFNKICSLCSDDELELLLKKYHVYFEEEQKKNGMEMTKMFNQTKMPDVVMSYFDMIRGLELLSPEVEKELFTSLNMCMSKLKILNVTDQLELKCDFATIFMSINDERQIKLLTELVKVSYTSNNGMIYEKIVAEKDRKIINKYLKLYQEKDEKLSYDELSTNFSDIDFSKYNNLSNDEFNEQIKLLIEFLTIIKRIQCANLKLVIFVAKQYKPWGSITFDFEDLIQEGNLGLMKAILRFDVSKSKFATYAVFWITQKIRAYIIDNANVIRKPHGFYEKYRQYKRVVDMYVMKYGRYPSIEEVAEELNISQKKCVELKKLAREPISLDKSYDEDDDGSMMVINKIIDSTVLSVSEEYEKKDLKEKIEEMLSSVLNEKELNVVRLHYGLDDGVERTLVEIGEKYKITKQAVNQIETRAFQKLRQKGNRKLLTDYVSNL